VAQFGTEKTAELIINIAKQKNNSFTFKITQ